MAGDMAKYGNSLWSCQIIFSHHRHNLNDKHFCILCFLHGIQQLVDINKNRNEI